MSIDPDGLGPAYEAGLSPARRRGRGAFYTPSWVADGLLTLATEGLDLAPPQRPRVCDPAVGGGAFLLAAARLLERAGHDRVTIVGQLIWGADLDGGAVAVARSALGAWLVEGSDAVSATSGAAADAVEALARHVVQGDSLARGLALWPDLAGPGTGSGPAPEVGFELVVGNPPFLNQLGRSTARRPAQVRALRRRLGEPVQPYTDSAALFLAAGTGWLAPGGRLALIVPESVLAARDAGAARATAAGRAAVVAFWWPGVRVFEAEVEVCAPVLERGAAPGPVARRFGPEFGPVEPAPAPDPEQSSWSALLDRISPVRARLLARLARAERLGERAEATAGFRDQFYGVAPFVHEAPECPDATVALVTVGLIDPLHPRWGSACTRFAGRRWSAPVVDLDALGRADPGLDRWARARLVPKVVLATQTRVLEAVVDTEGRWWPSVPAIAVTPRSGDPAELWRLAALLTGPAATAWAWAHHRGAALSTHALKLSAAQVLDLPLPTDDGAWRDGAAWAEEAQGRAEAGDAQGWGDALAELGRAMAAAHRCDDEALDWWTDRLPAWRPG